MVIRAGTYDAVSEVKGTIEFAKKIKQAQPKLYEFAFSKHSKDSISELLNVVSLEPVVHLSGMFFHLLQSFVNFQVL
ncbi:hypothetical protein TYM08_P1735 [Marinicellulosiphila megalodicopiae]